MSHSGWINCVLVEQIHTSRFLATNYQHAYMHPDRSHPSRSLAISYTQQLVPRVGGGFCWENNRLGRKTEKWEEKKWKRKTRAWEKKTRRLRDDAFILTPVPPTPQNYYCISISRSLTSVSFLQCFYSSIPTLAIVPLNVSNLRILPTGFQSQPEWQHLLTELSYRALS